jgi:hypothetical protein
MPINDIVIPQVSNPIIDQKLRPTPSYLVTIEDGKKDLYFVATKYQSQPTTGKFIGFFCSKNREEIVARCDELIKAEDKQNFVDIELPWQRIKCIRNLMYRQK